MSCLDGQHNYQPRYDKSSGIDSADLADIATGYLLAAIEAMRVETYVRDVCTRCGEYIDRD